MWRDAFDVLSFEKRALFFSRRRPIIFFFFFVSFFRPIFSSFCSFGHRTLTPKKGTKKKTRRRTKKFFAFLKEEGKKDDDDGRKKYARDKKKRELFEYIYYINACFFLCTRLRLRFFLRVTPLDLWSVSRRRAMMMERLDFDSEIVPKASSERSRKTLK